MIFDIKNKTVGYWNSLLEISFMFKTEYRILRVKKPKLLPQIPLKLCLSKRYNKALIYMMSF
jgi:hypothetical protein